MNIKKLIFSIIGIFLSFTLGIGAIFSIPTTLSNFTGVKTSIFSLILVGLIVILLVYIVIQIITKKEFKDKIFLQISNLNYFSFVPFFLAIIGVSIWSISFDPKAEMAVLFAIFGIPILFLAGILATIIISLKKGNSFDKLMSKITFAIIVLTIIISIISAVLSVASRNYYDLQYKKLTEDRPACSESFLSAYNNSLLIGDYDFCQNAFSEYGYNTTIPMGNNTYAGVKSCKKDNKVFAWDDCMKEMTNSSSNIN